MTNQQETRFQLADPIIRTDRLLFEGTHLVDFELGLPGVGIHVTLDGTVPTPDDSRVTGPVRLTDSTTISARAFHADWAPSDVVTRQFYRVRKTVHSIALHTRPSDDYPGRGADTLLDLSAGSSAFGDGSWLGYREDDLLATLDLGAGMDVSAVLVSSLANNGSWIFLPSSVEVETSIDGARFEPAAGREYAEPPGAEPDGQQFLRIPLATDPSRSLSARYLRVRVRGRGSLPAWHPAAGSPAWLFVDTITVQ